MNSQRPIHHDKQPVVAIIGGGLAGIAAASAAARSGLRVELFEATSRLGGRVRSFRDPVSGRLVDMCQHVSMGCCTNLADLLRATDCEDAFCRAEALHFIGPDTRCYPFQSAKWLPAPLHLGPALAGLGYLSLGERFQIGRLLLRMTRGPGADQDETISVGRWLLDQGATSRVIERFWSVILVSALGETVDRASLAAARKVFRDGFLTSRRAHEVYLPTAPLETIFHERMLAALEHQGVAVHLGTPVKQIEGSGRSVGSLRLSDGSARSIDFCVAAVPWMRLARLLPDTLCERLPELAGIDSIRSAPITAVHLWFDRRITHLPHAVLVGQTGQWLFTGDSPSASAEKSSAGFYYQVVISAAHEFIGADRPALISRIVRELAQTWPEAERANLLRWRMVTHGQAVMSMRPGLESLRPHQTTSLDNLLLAGDWTKTGWPSTMEGAVRSGYLAVEAILGNLGRDAAPILVPDLPTGRLAHWLI